MSTPDVCLFVGFLQTREKKKKKKKNWRGFSKCSAPLFPEGEVSPTPTSHFLILPSHVPLPSCLATLFSPKPSCLILPSSHLPRNPSHPHPIPSQPPPSPRRCQATQRLARGAARCVERNAPRHQCVEALRRELRGGPGWGQERGLAGGYVETNHMCVYIYTHVICIYIYIYMCVC